MNILLVEDDQLLADALVKESVSCSRGEYMLLKTLMESAGNIFTKENLRFLLEYEF